MIVGASSIDPIPPQFVPPHSFITLVCPFPPRPPTPAPSLPPTYHHWRSVRKSPMQVRRSRPFATSTDCLWQSVQRRILAADV